MENKKLKVKALIERGNDGTYGVYVDLDENRLNYGIIGEGSTAEEAKQDFLGCYEDMRAHFNVEKKPFQECYFEFEYDVASFLKHSLRALSSELSQVRFCV
jgi:hypothetical protein